MEYFERGWTTQALGNDQSNATAATLAYLFISLQIPPPINGQEKSGTNTFVIVATKKHLLFQDFSKHTAREQFHRKSTFRPAVY